MNLDDAKDLWASEQDSDTPSMSARSLSDDELLRFVKEKAAAFSLTKRSSSSSDRERADMEGVSESCSEAQRSLASSRFMPGSPPARRPVCS
mgnify:CR=1 FL=1